MNIIVAYLTSVVTQVRANLFISVLRNVSEGSGDPSILSALASLEAVSSASSTEQWVAQCANKYL